MLGAAAWCLVALAGARQQQVGHPLSLVSASAAGIDGSQGNAQLYYRAPWHRRTRPANLLQPWQGLHSAHAIRCASQLFSTTQRGLQAAATHPRTCSTWVRWGRCAAAERRGDLCLACSSAAAFPATSVVPSGLDSAHRPSVSSHTRLRTPRPSSSTPLQLLRFRRPPGRGQQAAEANRRRVAPSQQRRQQRQQEPPQRPASRRHGDH